MTTMTIPLTTLKTLEPILDTEGYRPALRYVGWRDGRLFATDGYILLMIDAESDWPDGQLIDARVINKIARAIVNSATVTMGATEDGVQHWTINQHHREGSFQGTSKGLQGLTPADWQGVVDEWTDLEDKCHHVRLNGRLLARLAAAANAAAGKGAVDTPIDFLFPVDCEQGVIFRFKGAKDEAYKGVLMPMYAPEWSTESDNEEGDDQ